MAATVRVTINDIHVAQFDMIIHVDGREPHRHVMDQFIMGGWHYDQELSQKLYAVISEHFINTRYGSWRRDSP